MSDQRQHPKHPNRVPFEGVLTRLDVPSDKAPTGSRGHRVILTREAAEDALDSLIGMAVGFSAEWEKHNARQKCGVITKAYIVEAPEGAELRVEGHIYCRDFPEVATAMRNPSTKLGMSYELCDAKVADMRASVYVLSRVTFTGAAILLRSKAAYRSTRISLQAVADSSRRRLGRFTGKLTFLTQGDVTLLVEE